MTSLVRLLQLSDSDLGGDLGLGSRRRPRPLPFFIINIIIKPRTSDLGPRT
eukprot:COSAG01_NODE_15563_length_1321_cov_2.705065_3_plen_50_part_01